jgi:serine/threonine-protein kinase
VTTDLRDDPQHALGDGDPARDEVRRDRRTLGIAALLAALVLAAGGAFLWWRLRTPLTLTDQTAVAVLPFSVDGGGASVRVMREGIPDLVAAKLTGRVHALDVRTVLGAWRRAGGEQQELPRDAAILLGRQLGAGAVLEGSVVAAGKDVTLSGTLIPVVEGRDHHATVRGPADSLPSLLDALVGRLLVLDAGASGERVSPLAGVPLDALQRYLAGRAAERAGHYAAAVGAYGRALDADSTFALAALRLWLAATSWAASPRAADAYRLAARHADRLGPRDRLLLGAATGPDQPRSCAETLRARQQAVNEAPDMPDLWYLLGETLTHCGPAMGLDDSRRRAASAFDHALTLDSTYTAAYEHLPRLYASVGDTVRARRAATLLGRADSAGAAITRAPLEAATLAVATSLLLDDGARADTADQLLGRLPQAATTAADRARAESVTRAVLLMRGRPARAAALMRASPAGLDAPFALLAARFWDGDTTLARAARDTVRGVVAAPPPDSAAGRDDWTSAAFALGADAAARRDTAELARAVAALRGLPAPPDAPRAGRARHLATLLDAELASLAGRGDAGAALAAADSMLREAPGGAYVEGAGNLIVASVWERAGDLPRAYAATRRYRMDGTIPFAFSTYLREQARLAERTGARDRAVELYRHYLALRRVAEPSLAAHLASVRAELTRLEQASAGR